jgi:hypothetical protein
VSAGPVVSWPGGELALLWLAAGYASTGVALLSFVRGRQLPGQTSRAPDEAHDDRGAPMVVVRWIHAFVEFWIDVIVGDDWTVAATVLAALLTTGGLQRAGLPAGWLLPAAVVGITTVRLRRATKGARRPTPPR